MAPSQMRAQNATAPRPSSSRSGRTKMGRSGSTPASAGMREPALTASPAPMKAAMSTKCTPGGTACPSINEPMAAATNPAKLHSP